MESKTKVIGYVRVSSAHQAEEGVSIDAQIAKLRAYAVAMDLALVDIKIDAGISAKTLERPALKEALVMLDAGEASGLLICKLDRITRSVKDLGWLVEKYFASKFSLLSLADSIDTRTAGGRLVLNVLASVSQWEREACGERTKDALSHLKKNEGVQLGGAALGWRRTEQTDDNGRKVVEKLDAESKTVERIGQLRAQGATLHAIARTLCREGHPTKRGGKWAPETVRKVLGRMAA